MIRQVETTEWLNSPVTQMLRAYLRNCQAHTLRRFKQGLPVNDMEQGAVHGLHKLEWLLAQPAETVTKTLNDETAKKEDV